MVITITMKNVIKRSETYYFRIGVPTDCRDSVGKREVTQSLQTNEAGKAESLAKALTADWKQKFKDIRNASSTPSPIIKSKTDDTVADFKGKLDTHIGLYLSGYLENQTEQELIETSEWLMNCIAIIKKNDGSSIDLSDELGVMYPLPKQKSPGMTRKLNKAIVDGLARIEYDNRRKGYFYENPTFMMPAMSMSEGELTALLLASRTLSEYQGSPVAGKLRDIFSKLSSMLPDSVSISPVMYIEITPSIRCSTLQYFTMDRISQP